ncbi:MAG: hypothetical protein ACLTSX_01765 [Collinsella sp.]
MILDERTIDCEARASSEARERPAGACRAMVYEARPNVTADAAGICIRTGNACILRGGSHRSERACVAIARMLGAMPSRPVASTRAAVSIIETTDRAATGRAHGAARRG